MTAPPRRDGAPWRNFYGRRKGKALRQSQVTHLDTTLSTVRVAGVSWDENPERSPLDLPALFGGPRPVWLEIGFGGGEHLAHMAALNPDIGLIGCEPFVNGVAMLLPRIVQDGLTNIRVHPGDARDLFDVLPTGSITRVFLLYPDPWPKKRHHRRRFVNHDALDPLARVMAEGAELRVATDIADYASHALKVMDGRPDFGLGRGGADSWCTPWADWMRTRYEVKALREGREPRYLTFVRRPGPAAVCAGN